MLLSIPCSKPCNNHRFPCDNFPEIHPSESGLNTSNRCFQITLSPQVHIILREEEKLLQLLEIYMLSEYILYIFWGMRFSLWHLLMIFVVCSSIYIYVFVYVQQDDEADNSTTTPGFLFYIPLLFSLILCLIVS